MRSSWSADTSTSMQRTRTKDRTQERIGDEDEETLHGVDPLELLEQAQIEQCVRLSIG